MIKYITEFLGTFFFLSIILQATAKNSSLAPIAPLAISLGLFASIAFGGSISGGHFNPAVSTMIFLNKGLSKIEYVLYVVSQLLGGIGAKLFFDVLK
jgi:aquaporin Z